MDGVLNFVVYGLIGQLGYEKFLNNGREKKKDFKFQIYLLYQTYDVRERNTNKKNTFVIV